MGSKIFDGKLDVVAREIRTPAGVTWSALEELAYELSQRKECNDAKLTEVLGMAKLGVQRLLNLSDRLALMNELDNAPSFELQRYHVDLREVVEESLGRATYLAARKAIKASSSFGDRACIVHVDARWLGAVVLEVCANAFRFATSSIKVGITRDPLLLLIEDDGPGFEDDGGRRATGLGASLAMASRVIEAHGGTLQRRASTIVPKPGKTAGAAIAIELPLAAA
ncbi:MAG TPA: HAMP domain-containing sensor histidine kinase [Polyangiaceae bacterium]